MVTPPLGRAVTEQAHDRSPELRASIRSVALATPPRAYTQQEFFDSLPYSHPIVDRLVQSPSIQRRYLFMPERMGDGKSKSETYLDLIRRHRDGATMLSTTAIRQALMRADTPGEAVGLLCCVTSTGFMVPSLSALLIRQLGLASDCQRIDIVGMGCNGGINGLGAVTNWAVANPNKLAVLLCCEINTAMYSEPKCIQDWIVNSLFGDGAAAIVVCANQHGSTSGANILDFQSHMATEHWDAMGFEWCPEQARWRFLLARAVPQIVQTVVAVPVAKMLLRWNLEIQNVRHWIVHGGGPALIEAVQRGLSLTDHHLRHSTSILRDFGNLSSGSFLFSLERLQSEQVIRPGDYGVMVTMGPGVTVETALLKW